MMYRPYSSNDASRQPSRSHRVAMRRRTFPFWLLLPAVAALLYMFVSARKAGKEEMVEKVLLSDDSPVTAIADNDCVEKVFRKRIVRDEIPPINFRQVGYRELFNDSNYVQLSAARANGIKPSELGDPASNVNLTPIFSTRYYKVDSMYHSRPYLVPEAVLLLDYIAHRYSQIMSERFPSLGQCNPIVTSALRTEGSERRLRRVNRNATDTSCHIYGTTFDLSAQRYEHVLSGRDTVIEACKEALARALYEIRYEGLCYVKYERGSCFHITLKTTQYEGDKEWELRSYVNPGSPDYLLTKAPPRPKPPVARQETKQGSALSRQTQKPSMNSVTKKAKNTKKKATRNNVTSQTKNVSTGNGVTERERLSLEQFERRY